MEGAEIAKFLYQRSLLLEYLLVAGIFGSIFRPKLLIVLATVVVLLRPNERMDFTVPFMQLLIPALSMVVVSNVGRFRGRAADVGTKCLNYFVILIMVETFFLHLADFTGVFLFISVGYLLYYTIIVFMPEDDDLKLLCSTVTFCCFLICLEPFYYHCTEIQGSELWNMFHLPKSGRLQAWGMWANANETAFIACLGIANILFLASKYKGALHFAAALVMVPFFATIVFLTASRAGFASLLLIFLPSVILAKAKLLRIIAVVAILCAIVLSHSMTPERTDAQGSTDERSDLRYRGRQIIKEYPIAGVGFLRARYEVGSSPLHNTYLQAFAETGIIGGLLLMTFLSKLGRNLYYAYQIHGKNNDNFNIFFVVGLYCSSIFYFYWGNQLLTIFFFIVMAQIITMINNLCLNVKNYQVDNI